MKQQRGERPQAIEQVANGQTAIRTNINKTDDGYEYDEVILSCNTDRGSIINAMILDRYPDGEEQAIHRKGILNGDNSDFFEYLSFVDSVKKIVDEAIAYDINP